MPTRLKSLELHGYKTFASKSLLEFAGDITAIVGPNGSGKSNVADAMRWVLGEQSYSLLRAKKTDDMIFAGSERRPRSGMASATITFNNEDNWLPIDYSEVSITRRAYRDGQNEYLLNGQRVRLKEINELLGRSGLAERTYTVIGQGLVDAALSLKPEERRRFFEEAAGIQIYRRRRDEALGRMETTRRNMDRALDILSEIKPRMRSLERQAERVDEYERLTADLRLLLRDWYGYHWQRTQQEITHAQDVFHVRENALKQAQTRLRGVEQQVAKIRHQLQDMRDQLNVWHAQSSSLHGEREQISKKLAVMDERQRALSDQKTDFASTMNRLQDELTILKDRLASYQEERKQLQQEVEEASQRVEETNQQLKLKLGERAVLENAIRNLRRDLTQLETEQVRLTASKNELQNRSKSLVDSLQSLDEQIAREENLYAKSRKASEDLAVEFRQAEDDLAQMEAEYESQQKKVRDIRQSLDEKKQKASVLMVDISRVQAQLKVLIEAERSFSGLNQGSQLLLKSFQGGKVHGRYRALNGLLEIPAGYEIAAAALMGELLDAVVVESGGDIHEALQLLEKGETGRTVLLPTEHLRGQELESVIPSAGCLGRFSDLITVPDDIADVVKLLFGQSFIMESREAALDLSFHLPPTACAVTLQGEIFRGDGVVIASREGGKTGILSRPRERKELQSLLTDKEKSIDILNNSIEVEEKNLQAMLAAERTIQANVRTLQNERTSAEKALRQVELEARQVEQRLAFLRGQHQKNVAQLESTTADIQKTSSRLENNVQHVESLQQQIKEKQRSLNDITINDLQREENHWRTQLAVATRALQDAETRVGDFERNMKSTETQLRLLQERISTQDTETENLSAEKKNLVANEEDIKHKIEELAGKIQPAEEQLQGLEQTYNSTQDDLTIAQQAASAAERHETQAQIELTRQRDSLESLREKVMEDFGLVAFQYEGEISGQQTLPFADMVEQLPAISELPAGLNDEIRRNRAQLRRLGAINLDAKKEFEEVYERHEFITQQLDDLRHADEDLQKVITELNELMRLEFRKTFDAVASEFKGLFTRLFGGGTARLEMTDEDNPTETGIEIHAKLPGRREQSLALLSGGERSLTAVALVFSLLKVSPTPFCILDEVDAMLDESNVGRFCDLLSELAGMGTQFIVITHNRGTVQASDVIYGVTKGNDSASQLISLKLDEVSEEMAQ